MSNTPKFTAPNVAELITARIEESAGEARIHYGLTKNPTAKFTTTEGGAALKAAQREIDDWASKLDITPFLSDASSEQIGADKVAELRTRVRCEPGATIGELILAVLQGKWARSVLLLTPLNSPIDPWVHWAHKAIMRGCPWMGTDQVAFTSLPYARNVLAQTFLGTDAEWAFFLDGDTVPPINNPAASYHRFGYNEALVKPVFLNFHAVDRLRSRNKTLIGSVVSDKKPGNRLIIQPDLHPKNDHDRQLCEKLKRNGPVDEVIPVPYIGTGCTLIHRSVFLDIARKYPELKPENPKEPFNYFGRGEATVLQGEDIAFSKLAAEAGHPAFLDLSVWCAHNGPHSFTPQPQL